ncbi:hypothetical protein LPJ61_004213 [Coemansia biformis]|uniref:Peptidase C51 domain-containing protein n=1 Tax=Coemansia biformis TaxID=1286918 RepID=A0A9W7Y9Y1_9FUNG|nr:hypothetical protein LPJ61_004213 [Coemansia biformis]
MRILAVAAGPLLAAAAVGAFTLNDKSGYANCRSEPTTNSTVVRQYKTGDQFDIECQVSGQRVFDYAIWDKTEDNCYLTDYYVDTGAAGGTYVTKNCLYDGPNPGPVVDDYRYKGLCDQVDPWNYYICQCVSFVAQRINERQRIYFTNTYKGNRWGDAGTWVAAARNSTGVKVNHVPKPGCIAQHWRSKLGHVAWVHSVNHRRKTVTIEQYNVIPYTYSTETVPWDAFDYYIHLDCDN